MHPRDVTDKELLRLAWEVLEPSYIERLQKLGSQYQSAQSKGLGSERIEEITRAALEGRVDTLLLEADRILPGRLNTTTGAIEEGDLQHPEVDDLLDDAGELVLQQGGQVVVVPRAHMPTDTGLAATFRY